MDSFLGVEIQPLFDDIDKIEEPNVSIALYLQKLISLGNDDVLDVYSTSISFLAEAGMSSKNSFLTYRTELEKFLQWCWLCRFNPLKLGRTEMRKYVEFCLSPTPPLIAARSGNRFYGKAGYREPGKNWAPWNYNLDDERYEPAETQERHTLNILNSFYEHLIDEELVEKNPCRYLLRKVKVTKFQDDDDSNIKMLTEIQWCFVLKALDDMVDRDPDFYWRVKFLVLMMYSMYLRIGEVSAKPGVVPWMNLFVCGEENYFRVTKSKGNKSRRVTVSDQLLAVLTEYRKYLGLPSTPDSKEFEPLFSKFVAARGGRKLICEPLGERRIRDLIGDVFAEAANIAESSGDKSDAATLREATPHWLRHTGISHDVNIHNRPISHVRDDAGHESIETTNKYLHTSLSERYMTAKDKIANL